jgi:sugar O-acyltransferase (sialic acid O-acetyltransferase NeuD family)
MKEKVVLVGAGGHCKVLIECLDRNLYEIIGILDNKTKIGSEIIGISVIGDDNDAKLLFGSGVHNAVIAIVGNLKVRKKLLDKYKEIGFSFPVIRHPSACISSNAKLGEGVAILSGAHINTGAIVQNFVTINTGAVVEHDVVIGDNSHIAPRVTLLGASRVGNDTMIGAGSVVLQQVIIGNRCTVGAGSIVLKNIKDGKTVYGNPAREKEL